MHGFVLLLRLFYRSFLCNQKITPFIKVDAISYNTFIKHLQKLTTVVEKKIKNAWYFVAGKAIKRIILLFMPLLHPKMNLDMSTICLVFVRMRTSRR